MSKKMDVKHVRFHDAVQAGGSVLTSLSMERHAAQLGGQPIDLLPFGIHFYYNGLRVIVPYANTSFIEIYPDEPAKKTPA